MNERPYVPAPMKRPAQEPPPGHAMARFVLAEDAKTGDVLDLDLNTGKLVVAAMTDFRADGPYPPMRIPTAPPPGLYLRALVANWQQQAQEGAQQAMALDQPPAGAHRLDGRVDAWVAAAGQLERTLDLMGVASLVADDPPTVLTARWDSHVPMPAVDCTRCARCGQPLIHVPASETERAYWLTEVEGLEQCEGPPPPNAGQPGEWVSRLVLEAALRVLADQADQLKHAPAGSWDSATAEEAAASALGHAVHVLGDVLAWRGEG